MAYFNGRPMDYIHFRWRRTKRQRGNADTRESNKKDDEVKHTHCLTGSEENYIHLEKEAWVILHCMGEQSFFHIYLYGAKFTILTGRQSRSTIDFRWEQNSQKRSHSV
jgi:hypothetical protein